MARELSEWEVARTGAGSFGMPGDLPRDLDWVAAHVPGTVAAAWRAAGRWSVDETLDFDADDWWFRATFVATPGRAVLDLGGIATLAEAWLNGRPVLRSDNMFHQHRVEVDLESHNELVVVCRSLTAHLAQRRPRPRWRTRLVESQNLRWVRTTFLGRMAAAAPRCAPVGLWRPVIVDDVADATVHSVLPRWSADGAAIELTLRSAVADPIVHVQLDERRFPLQLRPHGDALHARLEIDDIEPWFPATHGSPRLYDFAVVLEQDGEQRLIDRRRIGFRTVAADQRDGNFALSVNGVRTFCRGVVWAPLDPVGLHDDGTAVRDAVQQLSDAGINMLRVAGTGVYAQPELLDACDELGVLVWHDLMFANVEQPFEDDTYRASVVSEVREFAVRCQSHPSVVVVCGGSEIEQQAAMMGVDSSAARNAVGRELLPAIADDLLPDVVHVPCSPSGGDLPFQIDSGVSHYYGVGAYRRPLIDARLCGARFVSESLAFAAIPSQRSLDEWGVDSREPGSAEWKRRVPRDRGAGWDFDDVRDHYVEEIFGVRPLDVRYADADRYLDLGRAAVTEAVRATVAEFRRPTSPCNGVLVLCHRDALPGPGWGVVDAAGRPKSSYYGLRRAGTARGLSLHDEGLNGVRAAIHNDTPHVLVGELRIRLFAVTGTIIEEVATVVKVEAAGAVELGLDALFGHFTDLSYAYRFGPMVIDVIEASLVDDAGELVARARLLPGGHRRHRRADLGLRAWTAGDGAVTVRADQFAQFVSLDLADGVPEDDWFHLSPGEERTVVVRDTTAVRGSVRALNGYGTAFITAEHPS